MLRSKVEFFSNICRPWFLFINRMSAPNTSYVKILERQSSMSSCGDLPSLKKIKLEQASGKREEEENVLVKSECALVATPSAENLNKEPIDAFIENLEMLLARACLIEYNVNDKLQFSFG